MYFAQQVAQQVAQPVAVCPLPQNLQISQIFHLQAIRHIQKDHHNYHPHQKKK